MNTNNTFDGRRPSMEDDTEWKTALLKGVHKKDNWRFMMKSIER